ncbi:ribosome silencing factor [Ruminococcus sp.]|uniref:ribosome silencing factor n=1 Tax=Ruminococcus sp. TaxID=41978 RepID=UPI0025D34ABA|nr:ribosome silencing factor [Ruminococcus sp.]
MSNISQNEKLATIVKALDSKRAEDIQIIEIGDLTIVADYFVIANGTSSTQTKALAEEVEFKMSQQGIEPNRTEGYQGATWVVLDYGDIIVHVFYSETRNYYNLERLWSDGKNIDVKQFLPEETQD